MKPLMIEIINSRKISVSSYDKTLRIYDWTSNEMEISGKIVADFGSDETVFIVKVNGFGIIIYECLKNLGVNVVAFNLKRKYGNVENE
jgi:hypothetical protein